jgi:hypothetical protein
MRVLPTPTVPRLVLVLAALAFTAGCAQPGHMLGGPPDKISVDSEPQGAHVLASHVDVGATPVTIVVDEVFPKRWTLATERDEDGGLFYRRMGTLAFKKDGCAPYKMQVLSSDLTHDIKVKLNCDPNYKPVKEETVLDKRDDAVDARLERLEGLKKKGLITDEEYRAQRQRILDDL